MKVTDRGSLSGVIAQVQEGIQSLTNGFNQPIR